VRVLPFAALAVLVAVGCSGVTEIEDAPGTEVGAPATPDGSPAPVAPPVEEAPAAADEPDAAAPEKTTLRIMSFNIKHGEVAGHDFVKLTAPLLPSKPDVLALQEVDEGTKRSGGLKETEAIAKHMGMPHAYFGRNFAYDGGYYGLAIVSKFPLSNTRVIRLDDHTVRGNGYEPRIAVAAEVALGTRTITVVTVHASLKAEERPENAARIVKALGARAPHALVMGDLNETPGAAIGDALVAAGFVDAWSERHPNGPGYTAPAAPIPLRRIDYLFKGSAFGATQHAWVPDVTTSDHRPVAAVVTLPP
jgi:endonuclease/exonuclease/phosphatase family metal-dependent hydrolase